MAVRYQDIKAKVETTDFTKEELEAIEQVEKVIDERINVEFDNAAITFDMNIINFSMKPNNGGSYKFKDTRARIMMKELEKRYNDAGWKTGINYIDQVWTIQGK